MIPDFKLIAAEAAMDEIAPGMRIGLGTGSTAAHFVDLLGTRVADGFECLCVPTSERTAAQAAGLNIPLTDLETLGELDVTVDGADEIGPDLALIKGAGGALLREKIVAHVTKRFVVIADHTKLVETLGSFALPIEVNRFGAGVTAREIEKVAKAVSAGARVIQRAGADGNPFETDGGHLIYDASFGRISDARALSGALLDIPGVVQHGLFLDMCAVAYVAGPDGVKKLQR